MSRLRGTLSYVILVHITALFILSILRGVLFFYNNNTFNIDNNILFSEISNAFIRGVWFDNVIASYITITPLLILSLLGLLNKINKVTIDITSIYYIVIYGIVFGISAADIPYFNYFFKHINSSIFNWAEEGENALSMILQEKSYYLFFLIYFILFGLFVFLVLKYRKLPSRKQNQQIKNKYYFIYIPLCIFLIASNLLGIRGKLGRNPIKTSQAYFSNNSFLNQIGINPTFFLLRSTIENAKKHISANDIMSLEEAILKAQKYLDVRVEQITPSPICRYVEGQKDIKNINVVIILMESMSAELMLKDNGKLTPYLNKLKNESYYFNNFYSSGTHTNHGVTSTLFGLPALFDKNMMKNVDIPHCEGIATILKDKGYNTSFFVPHESQYDNMNAFLLENGFERIYAQEDYPRSKVANGFGVQDDYLFEYSLDKLNEYAKENEPFFTTILTVSNHPPYVVPSKYKSVADKAEDQIVAFADDAIKQFMTEAKKQNWYNNTIFVLLGDHGKIVGKPIYDMPLSYNHIPLIIHSPLLTDSPKQIDNLGGQIDILPTVLGLLDYSYANNTMGVDIIKNKRSYIYFTSDDMMGCLNNDFFYIYSPLNKTERLFKYKTEEIECCIKNNRQLADSMQNYAASMLIITDYMIKNKLTRL